MTAEITIGSVTAGPGEVVRGGIPIMGDMVGRPREIPIIVYRGIVVEEKVTNLIT